MLILSLEPAAPRPLPPQVARRRWDVGGPFRDGPLRFSRGALAANSATLQRWNTGLSLLSPGHASAHREQVRSSDCARRFTASGGERARFLCAACAARLACA